MSLRQFIKDRPHIFSIKEGMVSVIVSEDGQQAGRPEVLSPAVLLPGAVAGNSDELQPVADLKLVCRRIRYLVEKEVARTGEEGMQLRDFLNIYRAAYGPLDCEILGVPDVKTLLQHAGVRKRKNTLELAQDSEDALLQQLLEFIDSHGGKVSAGRIHEFYDRYPAAKDAMKNLGKLREFCERHAEISFVPDTGFTSGLHLRRSESGDEEKAVAADAEVFVVEKLLEFIDSYGGKVLRSEVNSELNFSPNFEGLVLGCIDADFCK